MQTANGDLSMALSGQIYTGSGRTYAGRAAGRTGATEMDKPEIVLSALTIEKHVLKTTWRQCSDDDVNQGSEIHQSFARDHSTRSIIAV